MGREARERLGRRLAKTAVSHLDAPRLIAAHEHLTRWATPRIYLPLVGKQDGPELRSEMRRRARAILAEGGFDGVDVRVLDGLLLRVIPDRHAAMRAIHQAARAR